MKFYCIEEFKDEIKKLSKKNSYKDLQQLIIDHFWNKSIDELKDGTYLNNNYETPYIKKRLGGSGGYRMYYFLVIIKETMYFLYVHPKTGPYKKENISREMIKEYYQKLRDSIQSKSLYEVDHKKGKLTFKPIMPV